MQSQSAFGRSQVKHQKRAFAQVGHTISLLPFGLPSASNECAAGTVTVAGAVVQSTQINIWDI
jgi:hypothetical protein